MEKNLKHIRVLRRKRTKLYRIMKLYLLFFIIGALQVSATVYSQNEKLNVKVKDVALSELLWQLQENSEFVFVYKTNDLKDAEKISLSKTDASLAEILDEALANSNLTYELDHGVVVIKQKPPVKVKTTESEMVQPQKIKVSGTVKDDKGEPIPFAALRIKGTDRGTVTDINGHFELEVDEIEGVVLEVSSIGFKNVEVELNGKTDHKIVLKAENVGLNEVVAIGYGSTKAKDLTGAVARIDPKVIENSTFTNVTEIIQGQVSGVEIISGGSAPGEPVKIRIRGESSLLGNRNPLIVINDVPMTVDFDLNDINPNDIQAIDVLKGASASAIFGSRASAGVLLITTKKGSAYTKPNITYSYNIGFKSYAQDVSPLNKDEFYHVLEESTLQYAAHRYPDKDPYDYSVYKRFTSDEWRGGADTDWVDILTRDATTQNHNISVRGGNREMQYNFSAGYVKDEGIMIGNDFERYNFRVGLDNQFSDRLKIGVNIDGNFSERISAQNLQGAIKARPDVPVYNEDGSYYVHTYKGGPPWMPLTYFIDNPLYLSENVENTSKSKNMNMMAYVNYDIIPSIRLRSQANYGFGNGRSRVYYPDLTSLGTGFGRYSYIGRLNYTESEGSNFVWDNTVTYFENINDHDIESLVGMTFTTGDNYRYAQEIHNFADDGIQSAPWQGTDVAGQGGSSQGASSVGYFGRLSYKYNDRYLFTGTYRIDGSSRFGENSRYGHFPSVSGGWIISEENFIKSLDWISFLKVRASWGISGNDQVGMYAWRTKYSSNRDYLEKPAVYPTNIGNPDLKWEKTKSYDLGLDFGFIKGNRIRGSVGYYNRYTEDMLYRMPLPLSTGFSSGGYMVNFGEIENKGYEFDLSVLAINTKNFNWDVGFNIAKNENKLVKLGVEMASSLYGSAGVGDAVIAEGQPLGLLYGYRTDGIFQTQEEIDYYESLNQDEDYQKEYSWQLTAPGDIKFVDLDGDGTITKDGDREIIGNTNPDFFGGFSSHFQYKNWDLNIFGTYSIGGKKYWKAAQSMFNVNSSQNPTNLNGIVRDSWTFKGEGAEYPTVKFYQYDNRHHDFWLFDASYLKVKEIKLSYNFNGKILNKIGIQRLNVFCSVNNVFTITKYPGYQVESYDSGSIVRGNSYDYSSYPEERIWRLGLRMNIQ